MLQTWKDYDKQKKLHIQSNNHRIEYVTFQRVNKHDMGTKRNISSCFIHNFIYIIIISNFKYKLS